MVAKTYDAKAAGITTGMPVWEAKKLLPESKAHYLSADFTYYGQMSDKMLGILARFSPEIEVYSIDEAFVGMNGLRGLWRKGFDEIAQTICQTIQNETGLTVSIGISVTKTLAKIASDFNKPNGVTLVPGRQIAPFLGKVKIRDIPGIGGNREALLHKFKIFTAAEYVATPLPLIQRLLGKCGADLWHELCGTAMFALELGPKLPKTVARTASLGEVTGNRDILLAHLTHHTTRLVTELVRKRYAAGRLTVFLTLKSFDKVVAETRFDFPGANYFSYSAAVAAALEKLYDGNALYRGCGVIASDLGTAQMRARNFDLFGETSGMAGAMAAQKNPERATKLLETVDALNQKFGKHTMLMLAALPATRQRAPSRFQLPLFEVD